MKISISEIAAQPGTAKYRNVLKLSLLALGVIIVLGISLFRRWEISPESTFYWYWARVFSETGRFVIFDRSPLYTLYLNAFRWLGYPSSVTVEYLVTSIILITSMVILFRKYLGLTLAVFAALLWLPYLSTDAEPPVQHLALACSCLAIVARQTNNSRYRLAVSYALLGLASMFRQTYLIFMLVFLFWDILQILRKNGLKAFLFKAYPKFSDWPVAIVIGLLIWFVAMQSPNPWNNAWGSSTTYFPTQGKSFSEANIQHLNWAYIESKYGSFEGKDFYFTNQEAFGGATNTLDAIRANPQFIFQLISNNIIYLVQLAVGFTMVPMIFPYPWFILYLLAISFILYGAFRACKNESMVLFVIANIFTIGVTVISVPKTRYMLPFIPILILSAYWYCTQVQGILTRNWQASRLVYVGIVGLILTSIWLVIRRFFTPLPFGVLPQAAYIVSYAISLTLIIIGIYKYQDKAQKRLLFLSPLALPLFLILLSTGVFQWKTQISEVIHQREIRVMENYPYSMKASYERLNSLIHDGDGVLALESTFIGAFMDVPLVKVYDVWEIPPFGHLGDPAYDGLRPDRINVIFISHALAAEVGAATNIQIRYQNYIKPYIEKLQLMGATTYEITGFGQAVILPKNR